MFGYIVPCVPELRVRELAQYRQYYCGLCRALKQQYGRTTDLAYDAAFVHILGDAMSETVTPPETVRCAAHPVRGVAARTTPSGPYAATVNILMAYSKALDDRRDSGSIRSKLRVAALERKYQKAAAIAPAMVRQTERCDKDIVACENNGCTSCDEAAEPYGVLFGRIAMELDVVQSHILYDLGYNIGRWVYLIDALDDMEADAKDGQYNVYNELRCEEGLTDSELRNRAAFSLHFTLAQAADALSRLKLKKNRSLLDNIVRLGLYQQTQSVLAGNGRITMPVHSEAGPAAAQHHTQKTTAGR